MTAALIVPSTNCNDGMLHNKHSLPFRMHLMKGNGILMVSVKGPLPEEYSLGLAMGYQLGIVADNRVKVT